MPWNDSGLHHVYVVCDYPIGMLMSELFIIDLERNL